MAEILKNLMWLVVAFLAPVWFPPLQKLFGGGVLTGIEWLTIGLLLVVPMFVLWQTVKAEKKERIEEIKQAVRQVFGEENIKSK